MRASSEPGPDVAILLHDLRGGGAERAMLRLAGGMVAAGRSVDLLLVTRRGEYLQDVPEGVTLRALDARSVSASVPALRRALERRPPRALLSALTHVNVAALLATRLAGRGKVVISERNQISSMAGAARRPRDRVTYAVARHLYRTADAVVAVSQGVADDVRQFARLRGERVRVIYNPVFDERLTAAASGPAPHPWLADRRGPVILGVGRLKHQKGFDDLLRAFAQLRRRRPARLVILGEGPERSNLELLARELGISDDVSLPGFCATPLSAMRAASLFVLPSRWEGFPNALVEAMAAGAPVVATDCPSGPREILDGGRVGWLAPVANAGALADAMERALACPADPEAYVRRASRFSVASAAEQYLDILGV